MDQQAIRDESLEQNSLLTDIATRNVICLTADGSVGEAAVIMRERRISSIVVTDDGGHPAGIVTERNILHAMQAGFPRETRLGEIMSAPVITVPESTTTLDGYHLCLSHGIRHLVIVDDKGALSGVASETDFRLHLNLTALAGRRRVASVAKRSAVVLPPATSLQQALDLMLSQRKSCVVVGENEKPVGIVTERDVVRFYSGEGQYADIRLSEAMVSPVQTIPHDATTNQAAEEMLVRKLRHLVVVDDARRLAGLVSEHDLTQAIASGMEEQRDGIEENFLRTLINTLPDLVWLKDTDGVFMACNARFEQLYGASESQIIGKTDYDFVDRQLADSFREHDRRAMEADGPSVNEEWLTFAADGYRGLFETIKTPMRDRSGKLVGVLGMARDISGRKQLERELEQSERKLHDIYDSVGDCIEIISMDGRILEMNRIGYERLGYDREEMVGHFLSEFTAPEQTEQIAARMALMREQVHATFESARRRKDGTFIPLEVRSRRMELDGQEVFLGISRDITERKQSEAVLAASERRYRTLVENSPFCIHEIDLEGRLLSMNRAGLDMLKLDSEARILGLSYLSAVSDQDRERIRGLMHDAFDGKPSHFEFSGTGDTPASFKSCFIPIRDGDGKVIKLMGITEDITARKLSENALREREEIFHSIVDQAPDSIVLFEADTLKFAEFNRMAHERLGYTREAFATLTLADIEAQFSEPELHQRIALAVANKYPRQFETLHRHKDGSLQESLVSSMPITIRGHTYISSIWSDITERKLAERALQESEEKLRTLIEAVPDSIQFKDGTGHWLEANLVARQAFGLDDCDCRGNTDLELAESADQYYRDSLKMCHDTDEATWQAGKLTRVEETIPLPDGGNMVYDVIKKPLFAEDGSRKALIIVGRDVTALKLTEDALRHSVEEYSELVRRIPVGVFKLRLKPGGIPSFDYVSPRWCEINGLDRDEVIHSVDAALAIIHPDELEGFLDLYRHPSDKLLWEGRARTKDGDVRWLHIEAQPTWLDNGDILWDGIQYDITEVKRGEESLRITASVFDASQEAIIITDADNAIIDVNPAFVRITGYRREEALGKNPSLLRSGRQSPEFYKSMWKALQEQGSWRGEIWNRRKNGEIYPEMLSINTVYDEHGNVQRHVGIFSDISHIKQHEAELSRVAHYDSLTGIPNRVLLADRMKQAIAQTSREQEMMAVCYLDLDGFKPINDNLGHDAGDRVLVEIARRIAATIRGGDTVARLGGDEFVILLLGLRMAEECVGTLERLLHEIAQPIAIDESSVSIGASIGVSIYPLDNEEADTLLRHADQAMYLAKQAGKHRFHIYDPSLDQRARDYNEFMKSIRQALELGQFELYYQPKINLRTKQLLGAEALIRWRHPQRGVLPPSEFLHAIENTELDIRVGEWVVDTALAQLREWRQAGLDIEISINISGYHLESPGFVEMLGQKLAHFPSLPAGKLQIEVLETTALEDVATVNDIIRACHELGVWFALDDFGTGYSSLSYLSRLPVDVLKIDQSFVRDMLEDRGDRAIVQGIIALAEAFERQIVAEGIETPEHYRTLVELGCEIGQGYYIARPMPAQGLVNWHAGEMPAG